MSAVDIYEECLSLEIRHGYYLPDHACLALVPAEKTRLQLARYGDLFRQAGPNKWHLLALAGKPLPAADDPPLVFMLKPLDRKFYYCTGEICPGPGFDSSGSSESGVWRQVTIPALVPERDRPLRLEIGITAARRYWEYLLIPRRGSDKPVPELRDEQDQLMFLYTGTVALPDASTSCRFITTDRIVLCEAYPYRLSLWEAGKLSGKLLSDTVPFPDPAEWSVTGAEDTITVYYYY